MKSTINQPRIKSRDPRIDSLKGVLIILVVFSHMIFPLIDQSLIKTIYLFSYLVHMPLFSFLSGYLYHSRSGKAQWHRLLMPYIFFQILYVSASLLIFQIPLNFMGVISPFGHLWYLWVLFIWGYIYELVKVHKSLLVLALAGVISVQMLTTDNTLEVIRLFTFLPFFLAGTYSQRFNWSQINILSKYLAWFMLMVILILIFLVQAKVDYRWVLRMDSYAELGLANITGALMSALLYFISTISGLVVIRLGSLEQSVLTKIGSRSLPIYLWNYLFVLGLYQFVFPLAPPQLDFMIAITTTVAVVVIFSETRLSVPFETLWRYSRIIRNQAIGNRN